MPIADEKPSRPFPIRVLVYGVIVAALLAVVVPSFLRARRSSGETPQLGEVRTMISAQAAYQAVNGGFYDQPRCLVRPQGCIPGYKDSDPAFLPESFLTDVRYGYRWTFHPGRAAPVDALRAGKLSPGSVEAWAYVAVPLEGRPGLRGFCGDARGILCTTQDGVTPPVGDGACVTGPVCRVLQ